MLQCANMLRRASMFKLGVLVFKVWFKVCMCICNGETFCCGFVGLSTGTDWEVVFQGV